MRRNKRKGRRGPMMFVLLVMVVFSTSFAMGSILPPVPIYEPVDVDTQVTEGIGRMTETETEAEAGEAPDTKALQYAVGFTVPVHLSQIDDTHYLELINSNHAISNEPDRDDLTQAWPTVPVGTVDIMVHGVVLEALRSLYNEAMAADAEELFVSSGYRDFDKQRQVYHEAEDKAYAALPGHSEHHTGLAVDIMILGTEQWDMAETFEGKWLAENAWLHGFIQRYPQDKEHITDTGFEPWHYRYVGQPHAYYCTVNNLCFEEYIELLKEIGGYQIELGGIDYTVLYQLAQSDIVYLPEDSDYLISGDNTGGYIVTAREGK